jgi:hypothetical protein
MDSKQTEPLMVILLDFEDEDVNTAVRILSDPTSTIDLDEPTLRGFFQKIGLVLLLEDPDQEPDQDTEQDQDFE